MNKQLEKRLRRKTQRLAIEQVLREYGLHRETKEGCVNNIIEFINEDEQKTQQDIFVFLKETLFKEIVDLCEYCSGELKEIDKDICEYHIWIKNYLKYGEKRFGEKK